MPSHNQPAWFQQKHSFSAWRRFVMKFNHQCICWSLDSRKSGTPNRAWTTHLSCVQCIADLVWPGGSKLNRKWSILTPNCSVPPIPSAPLFPLWEMHTIQRKRSGRGRKSYCPWGICHFSSKSFTRALRLHKNIVLSCRAFKPPTAISLDCTIIQPSQSVWVWYNVTVKWYCRLQCL